VRSSGFHQTGEAHTPQSCQHPGTAACLLVGIIGQLIQTAHQARPERIQMDIGYKLFQIAGFLSAKHSLEKECRNA
jgi:hypothetical protein